MDIKQAVNNNSEKAWLVLYLFVMIAVAGPLFGTLGDAWQESDIFKQLILALEPLVGISLQHFSVAAFGLYLGVLTLLVVDPKKRVQGLLLSVGTAAALITLLTQGLFLPNLNLISNIPLLVGGIILGGALGGGRAILDLQASESLEFRRAATIMFLLIVLIIIIGLIEYHIAFPQLLSIDYATDTVQFSPPTNPSISVANGGIFKNAALTVVLVATLRNFFQYDSNEEFFVLGPVGSGKSLFLVGTYLAALDEIADRDTETPMTPTADLMELVGEVDAASEDAGWELGATAADDVQDLGFNFVKGRVFPKNVQIGSLDYAGEYLDELPTALASSPDEIDNSILRQLADRVVDADTLVLILDMERYESEESLGIESYFDILDASNNSKVLIVATKCDVLAEEFEEQMGLDPVMYSDEFKDYVNETLTENDQTVSALIQDTAGSEIHPVYYQTTMNDGERVPMRDRNGNVQTMGFEELLEKLG